jgi:hypothetical protein
LNKPGSSHMQIRGKLELEVRAAGGEFVARRQATNLVLQSGANIIAKLFSGAADARPIDTVQVGFGRESVTADTKVLTPPPVPPPPGVPIPAAALVSPVTAANFSIVATAPDSIRVLVSTLFHPTVDLVDVSEAGLLAGDQLYNQVVFEPVRLSVGQDITFFWEIDFPFGH